MAETGKYSLSAVQAVISTVDYGQLVFGAASVSKQVSVGGGGMQVGSIGYAIEPNMFAVTATADGGAAVSFNAATNGTITISLKQTSPACKELIKFFKWCAANPSLAESTLNVTDTNGIVKFSATGVYPSKYPDNAAAEEIGDREFEFVACAITPLDDEVTY